MKKYGNYWKRWIIILMCVIMSTGFVLPLSAREKEDEKPVRVGWYESSFNITDFSGRKSGYAYEYQIKIAAYTGWNYEYVSGSWPQLMELLKEGEIDLMSDVSYVKEREEYMYFSSLPMGTEEYYLFTAPGNLEITPTDYESLSGKKIGVNKDSFQEKLYRDWEVRNRVSSVIVEITELEDESLAMLERGELDGYVTVDSFTNPDRAVPVYKIGSSDIYFAVNKERPDLLRELDNAMNRIQNEDRYYNQQLFEKFFKRTGANAFLTASEVEWLADHETIRIGYQDNYLAFCAADKETGELTGAMKDYLNYASVSTANAKMKFEPIAYPTAKECMTALQQGEVDCIFPVNLSAWDGEKYGVVITPPMMRADIYAIVREKDQRTFAAREHVVVAVPEGDLNYDALILDHFPEWRKVYYPDMQECLKAVSEGIADVVLISNFRFNNVARLCERFHLKSLTTGIGVEYCMAVRNGETELYSILAKEIGLVPDSTVNAALSYYVTEDARLTLGDFILDNLAVVMSGIAAVILIILGLLFKSVQSERKAQKLIAATETDELTGLYSRNFFLEYANHKHNDHPDQPMDAIELNIDQFHTVNALHGRQFGDEVLRELGSEIKAVAKANGGIAGRSEGDRFTVYCRHIPDYRAVYDRLQDKLDEFSQTIAIRLRMGVMPWQAGLEPEQMFDSARTACSLARGSYADRLVVFDEKLRARESYEQRLLNDLRRALDEYEFEVFYQPKFNIQTEPAKLVSAEALVRWRHHELGMISPADFIPLFERNGRIGEVDKYVWEAAARQIEAWREEYGVTVPISVNLSRVDVFDPELEETLDRIIAGHNLDHSAFKLEVTESAYTENAHEVIQVVENLRRKGFEVEMDDFGSGYSSLNMLSQMPIDVLKMDQAFIRNIEKDEKNIQLVALILGIAKNLKIPVVAEGVETAEQVRLLKDLGCEIVQGYFFSRPLSASDFEKAYVEAGPKDQ